MITRRALIPLVPQRFFWTRVWSGKPETRRPKPERRPKSEIRRGLSPILAWGERISFVLPREAEPAPYDRSAAFRLQRRRIMLRSGQIPALASAFTLQQPKGCAPGRMHTWQKVPERGRSGVPGGLGPVRRPSPAQWPRGGCGFRASDFGLLSDFGLRPSDLPPSP